MLPVTVWMNMPSFYQDDLFRGLSKKVDLRVVYDHPMTDDRRQLGWTEVKSQYKSYVLEQERRVRHAISIARSERDRVHIINGVWAENAFTAAAYTLGKAGTPFAIYTECPDTTVERGLVRRRARAFIGRWVAGHAAGLFAISHLASDYFGGLGFAREKIYPFGYFRESPIRRDIKHETNVVDLVCVGQLIHRKGLDVLIKAIKPLMAQNHLLRLSLIGTGMQQRLIEAELRREGLGNRVVLEGVLPSDQIHDRVARASALVLPSRWDGWGLVINEALCAGVPVIASDRCGGADLILQGVNGYKFRSEDVDDLRACLAAFSVANHNSMRAAALQTGSALGITVVADYLVACLEHMCRLRQDRPVPPWEETLRHLRIQQVHEEPTANLSADSQTQTQSR